MPSRDSKERLPKYVYVQRIGKHTYYRFRRRGGGSVRLPGVPDTPEFHAAYAKLLESAPKDIGRYTEGSVAHTIHLYRNSAKFSKLRESTRRDYERYLNRLDQSVGERPLASLNEQYAFGLMDKLKATPGAANHTIAVMRTLFQFAIKRKIVLKDPTEGVERLKGGDPYLRWPEDALAAFRRTAGPMMRLALNLGVYTGQRLSDVIAFSWDQYENGRLKLRQQKTGTYLVIPAHPELRKILDSLERRGLTILTSKTGLRFHSRVFSRDFRDARIVASLPDGFSFHGLRHTAASKLAEVGCTAPEIQAITGHKSLKQVEHYIRQSNQELQAERAIARLQSQDSAK